MTTTFHDSHLDTLIKLKALAEKHGMKIRFGTTNQTSNGTDASSLEDFNVCEDFINLLIEYSFQLIVDRIDASKETLWFELYDPRPNEKNGYYSVMSYEQNQVYFTLKDDWQNELDQIIDEVKEAQENLRGWTEDPSEDFGLDPQIEKLEKFREWLAEQSSEYGGFISFNNATTKIRGFGKANERNGKCYRDGMALHYFTELVCEYLKEPMIHNTY